MLHRLCGSPSIPLSFSLATVLPRRSAYRVSYGSHEGRYSRMPSAHRLQRGLLGYLIPFAPHAFVLAVSGDTQCPAYAFGVPNDINAFHYYTIRSRHLFVPQVKKYLKQTPQLSCGLLPKTILTTYRYALRPMIPDNA